jgi:hypothetical protein
MSAWQPLQDELSRWRAAGRLATLWCRDDDATRDTPALRRLFSVCGKHRIPVAVAAVPAGVEPTLADALAECATATIVQHGYAHRNHAAPGERNWELGWHRPLDTCIDELARGRERLAATFGSRFVAALVPPWNRVDAAIVAALPRAGLHGLSTFGPRAASTAAPGVTQCNSHVDVIAWRHGRGFIGAERAIALLVEHLSARRLGDVDAAEATGLLTHHLDMPEDAWRFVDALFEATARTGSTRWLDVRELFPVTSARSA